MTQPEPFMPDDLIRNRNWAELTAGEQLALKDVAATEEEFRLLKLMLSTTAVHDDVPAISPAVHERLKASFREAHKPRGKLIGWRRYAAAAAAVLAIAGTVWILTAKNKKDTVVAKQEKPTAQPVNTQDTMLQAVPGDTVKPVQPGKGTEAKRIPPTNGPVKPPGISIKQMKNKNTLPGKIPVTDPGPSIAVNINTSVKENSELLQLVAAVY